MPCKQWLTESCFREMLGSDDLAAEASAKFEPNHVWNESTLRLSNGITNYQSFGIGQNRRFKFFDLDNCRFCRCKNNLIRSNTEGMSSKQLKGTPCIFSGLSHWWNRASCCPHKSQSPSTRNMRCVPHVKCQGQDSSLYVQDLSVLQGQYTRALPGLKGQVQVCWQKSTPSAHACTMFIAWARSICVDICYTEENSMQYLMQCRWMIADSKYFRIALERPKTNSSLLFIVVHLSGNRERGAGDPRRRLWRRADRRVRQHVRVPLRRQGYQVGYKWCIYYIQWSPSYEYNIRLLIKS